MINISNDILIAVMRVVGVVFGIGLVVLSGVYIYLGVKKLRKKYGKDINKSDRQ